MLFWWYVGVGIGGFVISFVWMLNFMGEYKNTLNLIQKRERGEQVRFSDAQLASYKRSEYNCVKYGLYGMLLSPVWPIAVPLVAVVWFFRVVARAALLVIKEKP